MSSAALSDTDPGTLQLLVIGYGSEERRVEIQMRPKVPADCRGNASKRNTWSQMLMIAMGADVKHTEFWECEFCGQPAKETLHCVASWTHLSPPRLNNYLHHLCNGGPGPCKRALDALNAQLGRETGCALTIMPRLVNPVPGRLEDYPLARTCGKCHATDKGLSRCSKCKLMRYCSVACQRADWPRHKDICKTVKSVKWVWH